MKNALLLMLSCAVLWCAGAEGDAVGSERGFGGRGERGFGGRGERGFGGRGERNFSGNRSNRSNRSNRGMMRSAVVVESEIAKKYPAEYAEVEALREKYEAALADLAKKAGVELQESMDSKMRKVRKADPAGFDAAVEKMKTSPREGMMQLNEVARKAGITLWGGPSGNNRGGAMPPAAPSAQEAPRSFNRPNMAELRRKYPEAMKEYDTVRSKNPEKARKMLLEIIEKDKSAKK